MLQPVLDIPLPCAMMGVKTFPVATMTPGRWQKLYVWFGEPICTERYNGDDNNDNFAIALRDEVKASIEAGIQKMRKQQELDPDRYLLQSMRANLRGYFKPCSNSS